jgi:hypothetical protein
VEPPVRRRVRLPSAPRAHDQGARVPDHGRVRLRRCGDPGTARRRRRGPGRLLDGLQPVRCEGAPERPRRLDPALRDERGVLARVPGRGRSEAAPRSSTSRGSTDSPSGATRRSSRS